jgi:hypothetical protein
MNGKQIVTKGQVEKMLDVIFSEDYAATRPKGGARQLLEELKGVEIPGECVMIPLDLLAHIRKELARITEVVIATKDDMSLEAFLRTQNGTKTYHAKRLLEILSDVEERFPTYEG